MQMESRYPISLETRVKYLILLDSISIKPSSTVPKVSYCRNSFSLHRWNSEQWPRTVALAHTWIEIEMNCLRSQLRYWIICGLLPLRRKLDLEWDVFFRIDCNACSFLTDCDESMNRVLWTTIALCRTLHKAIIVRIFKLTVSVVF